MIPGGTMRDIGELKMIAEEIGERVKNQQAGFHKVWENGTEADVFSELVFCLCTPQTKARMAEKAVSLLRQKGLLFDGDAEALGNVLNIVRFRYHKAAYIVEARRTCSRNGEYALRGMLKELPGTPERRDWLARHVMGLGWKESSHFLRNVGFGAEVAILDRHILRNLVGFGVIQEEPKSLTPKRYEEIEDRMIRWSAEIGIPMDLLDFVLWYREAQDVFK